MNTHDLAPWEAYWNDLDIDERVRLGLLSPSQATAMRKDRQAARRAITTDLRRRRLLDAGQAQALDVLQACLSLLGASSARLVMVNLEDLWRQTQGQNLPGAPQDYPNWRRKARYSLEEFSRMPQVVSLLDRLNQVRRERSPSTLAAHDGRGASR